MQYEVEQKFPADDFASLEARLSELGASFGEPIEQSDRYYNHPTRDFAQTDEALRIRRVGDSARITYKGPKLDSQTKTRREIELPIGESGAGQTAAEQLAALLEALGFRYVAEVKKTRRPAQLDFHGCHIEVALDDVTSVGRFIELETQADDATLSRATQTIQQLAADLALHHPERRSYLELLLDTA